MPLTLSPRVRALIYVVTALGTPLVAYLNARGLIGPLEVTLWSAEVAAAGAMAALKTTDAAASATSAPAGQPADAEAPAVHAT